jgi:hypothetical protein
MNGTLVTSGGGKTLAIGAGGEPLMEKTHVIVVGSETPEIVRQLKMIPAAAMDQAFAIAKEKVGQKDLDVLAVPHALLTLPIVGDQKNGRED